jgi:signal transduction histidine kinase
LVRGLTLRTMLTSIVIALTGIVAQLAVVRYWSASGGLVVLSSLVVTLAVWGALRHVSSLYAERAARLRYHATLGRLAAQMAHDVRNPLAAVRGSAEFLLEERARGRSLDEHAMYLELILEQTDRIGRVVEDYQRLGRAEAKCACLDLGDTLRDVVTAQRMALGEGVDVLLELEGGPCTVMADAGLLVGAVENLLRNAHEAMPKGGTIRVVVERKGSLAVVRVVDTGQGMDASTREAALDDFFTTKAKGSGLGLSFVRRVAEAHGSSVRVTSAVGKGTTVELGFPLVEEGAVPSLGEAGSEVI